VTKQQDDKRIKEISKDIPQELETTSSPTFSGVTLSGLTASRLVASDGSKSLSSVTNLTSWIAGTTDRVTVTNDGDGTATLTIPDSFIFYLHARGTL